MVDGWAYWGNMHDLTRELQEQFAPGLSRFTLPDILKILEAVHDRLGRRFHETACHDLETKLLRIEEANGTGRVRLLDFYSSFVNGAWNFRERIDYLRQLGMLDESDPAVSRLIVPNYLNMQANC